MSLLNGRDPAFVRTPPATPVPTSSAPASLALTSLVSRFACAQLLRQMLSCTCRGYLPERLLARHVATAVLNGNGSVQVRVIHSLQWGTYRGKRNPSCEGTYVNGSGGSGQRAPVKMPSTAVNACSLAQPFIYGAVEAATPYWQAVGQEGPTVHGSGRPRRAEHKSSRTRLPPWIPDSTFATLSRFVHPRENSSHDGRQLGYYWSSTAAETALLMDSAWQAGCSRRHAHPRLGPRIYVLHLLASSGFASEEHLGSDIVHQRLNRMRAQPQAQDTTLGGAISGTWNSTCAAWQAAWTAGIDRLRWLTPKTAEKHRFLFWARMRSRDALFDGCGRETCIDALKKLSVPLTVARRRRLHYLRSLQDSEAAHQDQSHTSPSSARRLTLGDRQPGLFGPLGPMDRPRLPRMGRNKSWIRGHANMTVGLFVMIL